MKFSCEKALCSRQLPSRPGLSPPKSSIPALEGILLEARTDLRLTGYNLETGIRTVVPAQIDQEGSLVLSARLSARSSGSCPTISSPFRPMAIWSTSPAV